MTFITGESHRIANLWGFALRSVTSFAKRYSRTQLATLYASRDAGAVSTGAGGEIPPSTH